MTLSRFVESIEINYQKPGKQAEHIWNSNFGALGRACSLATKPLKTKTLKYNKQLREQNGKSLTLRKPCMYRMLHYCTPPPQGLAPYPAGYWRNPMNTNLHASRGASKLGGLGSHSLPLKLYRVAVNGTYMVVRIVSLLFLNCFARPCLPPAQLCFRYHFVHLWAAASERARFVFTLPLLSCVADGPQEH